MARLLRWFQRVPVWVWLLLAATQLATIIGAASRVSDLSRALVEMPDDEPYQDVGAKFRELLWDNQEQLVLAAVAGVQFLGLAIVRIVIKRGSTASSV